MYGSIFGIMNEEQCEEVEVLQAIYVDEELELSHSGDTVTSLTVHLLVEDNPVDIHVRLLPDYPAVAPPTCSVSASILRKQELGDFNEHMKEALESELFQEECPCICSLVSWVEEQIRPLIEEKNAAQHEESGSDSDGIANTESNCVKREWIWFIGFYTQKIITAFAQEADSLGLSGFLMPGKPAVACLEGSDEAIKEFLKQCRTTLFATVPAAGRKMKLVFAEESPQSKFADFSIVRLACESGSHKRKDISSLEKLEAFLMEHDCADAFSQLMHYCV